MKSMTLTQRAYHQLKATSRLRQRGGYKERQGVVHSSHYTELLRENLICTELPKGSQGCTELQKQKPMFGI